MRFKYVQAGPVPIEYPRPGNNAERLNMRKMWLGLGERAGEGRMS
jgi:hypothetical protein